MYPSLDAMQSKLVLSRGCLTTDAVLLHALHAVSEGMATWLCNLSVCELSVCKLSVCNVGRLHGAKE